MAKPKASADLGGIDRYEHLYHSSRVDLLPDHLSAWCRFVISPETLSKPVASDTYAYAKQRSRGGHTAHVSNNFGMYSDLEFPPGKV